MQSITQGLFLILTLSPLFNLFAFFLKKNNRTIPLLAISFIFSISIATLIISNYTNSGIHILDEYFLNQYIHFKFSIISIDLPYILMLLTLYPLNMLYSVFYFKKKGQDEARPLFFALVNLAISCAIMVIMSKDLLILFVFYEMLTLITYYILSFECTLKVINASKIYIRILVGTSVLLLLPAILMISNMSETLDLTKQGLISSALPLSNAAKYFIISLFIFGASKAAMPPFHSWLIEAMAAPAAVSSLFHAVLVVKIGIFVIFRLFINIFPVEMISSLSAFKNLNYVTIFAMMIFLFSGYNAYMSEIIKKKLAHSTINQLSFIIFIISLNPIKMLPVALFYTIHHSLSKINLFFFAGELEAKDNITTTISIKNALHINILSKIYLSVAAVNLIGLPFTLGYQIKKLALSAQPNNLVAVFVICSSLMTFLYLKDIVFNANINRKNPQTFNAVNIFMSIPGILIAAIQLYICFNFNTVLKYITKFSI